MARAHQKKSAVRSTATPSDDPITEVFEPDLRRSQKLVLDLLAVAGRSGEEARVAQFIRERLLEAGAPLDAIRVDQAQRRTPLRGEVGNLVFKLPGTYRGPRRLLMAHMDTVPLCEGTRPIVRGDQVAPADRNTALGADDRAGVAVVLHTAMEILRRRIAHPPLTFFWTIQEEVGLYGARNAQLGMLGRPQLAFNFDGGSHEKITIGATGGYRMDVQVHGVASHAGSAPEKGVSAIAIASLAVARLHEEGWHGLVEKNGRQGTSNVGVISGGEATNVVTPYVKLRAEARSHDPVFRQKIIRAIEKAFRDAAREVRNREGLAGRVEIDGQLDYEAFRLADDEPCVLAAEAAVRATGGEPIRAISNGGLDANWMTARGIPTVSLGCGQQNPHTTEERLSLPEYRQACRVALRLATGTERTT